MSMDHETRQALNRIDEIAAGLPEPDMNTAEALLLLATDEVPSDVRRNTPSDPPARVPLRELVTRTMIADDGSVLLTFDTPADVATLGITTVSRRDAALLVLALIRFLSVHDPVLPEMTTTKQFVYMMEVQAGGGYPF